MFETTLFLLHTFLPHFVLPVLCEVNSQNTCQDNQVVLTRGRCQRHTFR